MGNTTVLKNEIDYILNGKNLSYCKFARLAYEHDSSLISMIKEKRPFTKKAVKKILPILEVSQEEFESWIIADKYPKELLERAYSEPMIA